MYQPLKSSLGFEFILIWLGFREDFQDAGLLQLNGSQRLFERGKMTTLGCRTDVLERINVG
jgi:hypothetical protein